MEPNRCLACVLKYTFIPMLWQYSSDLQVLIVYQDMQQCTIKHSLFVYMDANIFVSVQIRIKS